MIVNTAWPRGDPVSIDSRRLTNSTPRWQNGSLPRGATRSIAGSSLVDLAMGARPALSPVDVSASQTTPDQRTRPIPLALLGLVLALAGVVGYLVVVFRLAARLPHVRNDAVPNWIIVAVGLVLSGIAVARATRGHRLGPGLLLTLTVAVTAAFAAILYVVPVVREAHGPSNGTAAPAFALADQTGTLVRLADFRGKPLLLVFYRWHW